jgi:hypothetical protein
MCGNFISSHFNKIIGSGGDMCHNFGLYWSNLSAFRRDVTFGGLSFRPIYSKNITLPTAISAEKPPRTTLEQPGLKSEHICPNQKITKFPKNKW